MKTHIYRHTHTQINAWGTDNSNVRAYCRRWHEQPYDPSSMAWFPKKVPVIFISVNIPNFRRCVGCWAYSQFAWTNWRSQSQNAPNSYERRQSLKDWFGVNSCRSKNLPSLLCTNIRKSLGATHLEQKKCNLSWDYPLVLLFFVLQGWFSTAHTNNLIIKSRFPNLGHVGCVKNKMQPNHL